MQLRNKKNIILFNVLFCLSLVGCRKQLEVTAPSYTLNQVTIYQSDASAVTVLNGIYSKLSQGDLWRLSYAAGLSADELTLFAGSNDPVLISFYKNSLRSQALGSNDVWTTFYPIISYTNAVLNGINLSSGLTDDGKKQLTGEAKFIRAFLYFYLVNLYGDVPLTLTTDYKANASISRTAVDNVWQQIIIDLKDAQSLLSNDYRDGTALKPSADRVRPTSWAATALLSRAYLYRKSYAEAEAEATKVINNTTLFTLPSLELAFQKNSTESIWQLQPVNFGQNTQDAIFFVIPNNGITNTNPVYLSDTLLKIFEPGDGRKTIWVGSITSGGLTYFFPNKYKVNKLNQPVTEQLTLFRLAEQYLIRAEARINQSGKVADGIADLNSLRDRARLAGTDAIPDPLPALNNGLSMQDALKATYRERQVEMFTELGQRWLDLKRTGRVDEIMNIITSQKGGSWNSNWQFYPIPIADIERNPNLVQNPGYIN